VNLTIVKTLTKGERSLIMDTRPKKLAGLSEDQLLDLHGRVRRGRNKYKKNFRQGAAKGVKAKGSRAVATKERRADAQRREVFEEALARVSERLAKAARRSADELRTKRLARAKQEKAAKAAAKARAAEKAKAKRNAAKATPKAAASGKRTSKKTPVSKKSVAGQRARKARKNAGKGR
jgi:hypothetical protein